MEDSSGMLPMRQLSLSIEGGVLVLLGCNKVPHSRWLINNRNVFLMVLEDGSPRSGCQHCQVRALLHKVAGARDLCGVSFIRALIPFMRAPPSGSKHLLKATPPPNTITAGNRTLTYEI